MEDRKKIVFFILSLTKGGAEHVIANMANDYFAKKYDVTIITCMKAPIEYPICEDVKILTLDVDEKDANQGMGKRFLRRRNRMKKYLKSIYPDVLVSFLPEPNFICLSLRKKMRIPTIISVRNDPQKEYAGKVRTALMKTFYPLADAYVFQTEDARDYFRFSTHIQENSSIIMNPLGREFLETEVDFERMRSNKTVINVGRLEKQKNQQMLIRVFHKLADEYPEWNLRIYGEGSLRESLQKQIDECNRNSRISLCGNADGMKEIMQNSGVFVLSSLYEGMPNAMMEALSMGMAVIATDCPCGGPATLLKNKDAGLLIPVDDADALEQSMRTLFQDERIRERYGRNAISIRMDCEPGKVYGEWEELMLKLMEGQAVNGR